MAKRVLVADDDPSAAVTARIILQREGYEVHMAEDGEKGWELFVKLQPYAILSDIHMPRLNGIDLTRKIKEASPETPVLLLTGSSKQQEGDIDRGLAAGADDYLEKPYTASSLMDLMKKYAPLE